MSILDIKVSDKQNPVKKTVVVYLFITILTITVNKVYSLYGHGVSSDAMTYMFLYPLIGGSFVYLVIALFFSKLYRFKGYRRIYNLYNSGIAVLTVGSMLKGVVEIAGTASLYIKFYYIVGYALLGGSLLFYSYLMINYKKLQA